MNHLLTNVTAAQLRQAADIKQEIESLQNELNKLLGTFQPRATVTSHRMSPAAITKTRGAAKARWALKKAAKLRSSLKSRRVMSAAAKAKLAEIARARWKKAKAAGRTAL